MAPARAEGAGKRKGVCTHGYRRIIRTRGMMVCRTVSGSGEKREDGPSNKSTIRSTNARAVAHGGGVYARTV